jgi:hypothetical protein
MGALLGGNAAAGNCGLGVLQAGADAGFGRLADRLSCEKIVFQEVSVG